MKRQQDSYRDSMIIKAIDELADTNYMLATIDNPDIAMARIEIVTYGSKTCISMPEINIGFERGIFSATFEYEGTIWRGTADSQVGAIVALLAERIGFQADVVIRLDNPDTGIDDRPTGEL